MSQHIDLIGGAGGNRTHDLLIANQALSQLSYSPMYLFRTKRGDTKAFVI